MPYVILRDVRRSLVFCALASHGQYCLFVYLALRAAYDNEMRDTKIANIYLLASTIQRSIGFAREKRYLHV
jgi:hypothetical protein